jgi:hypothetical protein
MKNLSLFFSFFFVVFPLFLVGSCGMPQSKTTLKVTNSMAVGNNTYQGGLVFYGRSAGGKFFSAPIKYTASNNSNTAEIILDKGVWTFAAVGWKNDPDVFEGESECAVTTVNLDADNKTVVLDLDPSNCNNNEFGGSGSYNAANGGFSINTLITCGTLYKDSSTETLLDPLNPSPNDPYYCSTNTNITPDLKVWAKSARIKIPVIKPGQPPLQASDLSFCQVLDQGKSDPIAPPPPAAATINNMLKRLPPKGVPFIVELHDDGNCTSPIKKYELREGLKFTYPNFDHEFYNSNLFLLTTISQRGQSSLMDSLPSFKCSATNPCSVIPESSQQRFIQPSAPFYLADETDTINCENLTAISNNSTFLYPLSPPPDYSGHCETRNDRIFIKLSQSDLSTGLVCSSCALSFSFNGLASPINRSVSVQGSTIFPLAAYNLIFSSLGHEDIVTTPLSTYKENGFNSITRLIEGDNEDTHYGFLSAARELFGPQTVGGLFSNYNITNIINTEYNIALWEDGVQKSFNLKIESNNDLVPTYLKADAGFYGSGTPTNTYFSHQLTISQIVGGVFIPQKILKWVYGKKVGILEEKNSESDDGKLKTYRRMIGWNTESIGSHRIEKYDYELESLISTPSVITKKRSSFTRAEKAGADDKVRIESFNYQSQLSGTNSYQDATKEFVSINGGYINYSRSDASAQKGSGDPDFFAREGLDLMTPETSLNHKAVSAISPNKNHLINAWAERTTDSTVDTWSINILLRSSTAPYIKLFKLLGFSSSDQPKIKVTTNNGGQASIAWSTNNLGSNTSSLYAMTWDVSTSSWVSAPNAGSLTVVLTSGVYLLSSVSSFVSNNNKTISFDLYDENSSSTGNSTKNLLYSYYDGSSQWYIKGSQYTGSWSTASSFYGGSNVVPYPPLFLNMTKNSSTVYLISFFYYDSTSNQFKLKSFKLSNGNLSHEIESSPSLGLTVEKMYARAVSANQQALYFQATNPVANSMKKLIYDVSGVSTGTHSSPTTFLNQRFNDAISNYCFQQKVNSTATLGDAHDTDSCAAPVSSYAPAIRSSVLIDTDNDGTPETDVGFKHNIQSLNPATFKFLFTMP